MTINEILIGLAEKIADFVIYGERQEQNVLAEEEQWLCFLDEIAEGSGTTSAASHRIAYKVAWAFCYPVGLESPAMDKSDTMQTAKAKCIAMLNAVIGCGYFDRISSWYIERVRENEYDVNAVGWRLSVELTPLQPEAVC